MCCLGDGRPGGYWSSGLNVHSVKADEPGEPTRPGREEEEYVLVFFEPHVPESYPPGYRENRLESAELR